MKDKLITQKFSKNLGNQGTCSLTEPNSLVEGCITTMKDSVQNPGLVAVEGAGAALAAATRGPVAGLSAIGLEGIGTCAVGGINTAIDNCSTTYKPWNSSINNDSSNSIGIKPVEPLKFEPIKPIEPVTGLNTGSLGINNNPTGINLSPLSSQTSSTIDSSINLNLSNPSGTSNIDLTGITIPDLH